MAKRKVLASFGIIYALFSVNASQGHCDVQLSLVGRTGNFGNSAGIFVVQDKAYLSNGGNNGFSIVDVHDASNPTRLGATSPPAVVDPCGVDLTHRPHVLGQYAYVPEHNAGLQIVDITVPAAPVRVGSIIKTCEAAEAVQVSSGMAYLASAGHGPGFRIIDVSNPAAPVDAGALDM